MATIDTNTPAVTTDLMATMNPKKNTAAAGSVEEDTNKFLTLLVTEEITHRQQTRLGRLTRRAHFPFLKTIDDFNFTFQLLLQSTVFSLQSSSILLHPNVPKRNN